MDRHAPILPRAIEADRHQFEGRAGSLAYYVDGPDNAATVPPLLLIHSVNAAASAFEVHPIFKEMRRSRRVYAMDLPGYGFSDRSARNYRPRLFVDGVKDMVDRINLEENVPRIDALAISLSSEFLGRAATEMPDALRTLTLVTPTGFSKRMGGKPGPKGATGEVPGLYATLTFRPWKKGIFGLLTSRSSIRFFLRKTFGRKDIDEGFVEYDYLTSHQSGAEHAPFAFVSGRLFSRDIRRVYEQLAMPIWMPHGTKGDFKDFSAAGWLQTRPNWQLTPFETGALPHFEEPAAFNEALRHFLDSIPTADQSVGSPSLEASASP